MTLVETFAVEYQPNPFAPWNHRTAAVGLSLRELAGRHGGDHDTTVIFVNGVEFSRGLWDYQPDASDVVQIAVRPELETLVAILVVASQVAAAVPGAAAIGSFASGLGFAAAGGSGALIAGSIGTIVGAVGILAGVSFLSQLAVSSIADSDDDSGNTTTGRRSSPTRTGEGNRQVQFAPIWEVFGQWGNLFPPLGGPVIGFTENEERLLRYLFVVGEGPMEVDQLRFGETPIEDFGIDPATDVAVRQGFPDDAPLSIYKDTFEQISPHVLHENFAFEDGLTNEFGEPANNVPRGQCGWRPSDWTTRTSPGIADELMVELHFENGLGRIDKQGRDNLQTLHWSIEYRKLGETEWREVSNPGFFADLRDHTLLSPRAGRRKAPNARAAAFDPSGFLDLSQQQPHGIRLPENEVPEVFDIRFGPLDEALRGPRGSPFPGRNIGEGKIHLVNREDNWPALGVVHSWSEGPYVRNSGFVNSRYWFPPEEAGTCFRMVNGGRSSRDDFYLTFHWRPHDAPGEYEVRFRREEATTDDALEGGAEGPNFVFANIRWLTLTSVRNEAPLDAEGLCTIEVVARNEEIGNEGSRFNCRARRLLNVLEEDEDGNAQLSAAYRFTQSAADAYAYVATHGPDPMLPAEIDLVELLRWKQKDEAEGRRFNVVIDYDTTRLEAYRTIAAAARGSWEQKNNLLTVVLDEEKTKVEQTFSPRTSSGFVGQKRFDRFPHGIRAQFHNESRGYQRDEMLVFNDGYSEKGEVEGTVAATVYETKFWDGITDPVTVYKDTRMLFAEAKLRPEVFRWHTGLKALRCSRGDLVRYRGDGPLIGIADGRIRGGTIATDGSGHVTSFDIDETIVYAAGKEYAVRIWLYDGSLGDYVEAEHDIVNPGASESETVTLVTPIVSPQPTATEGREEMVFVGERTRDSLELIVSKLTYRADLHAELEGIPHSPEIFAADSGPIPDFDSKASPLPAPLQTKPPLVVVRSMVSDESVLINRGSSLVTRLRVGCATVGPTRINFTVQIRWTTTPPSRLHPRDLRYVVLEDGRLSGFIENPPDGQRVWVSVRSRSADPAYLGRVSKWSKWYSHVVVGKSTPPPDIPRFVRERVGDTDVVLWDYPDSPLDVRIGGGFELRYHLGENRHWASARPLHEGLVQSPFSIREVLRFDGTVTIFAKAIDAAGNESANPAVIVAEIERDAQVSINTIDNRALDWVFVNKDRCAADSAGTPNDRDLVADAAESDTVAFWSGTDSNLFWTADTDYFWSADYFWSSGIIERLRTQGETISLPGVASLAGERAFEDTPFWSGDDTEAFWDIFYPFEFYATVSPSANNAVPGELRLDLEMDQGIGILLYERTVNFWSGTDADAFWASNDAALFWTRSVDKLIPFPGALETRNQNYNWRGVVLGGRTRGRVANLVSTLTGGPALVEEQEDVSIAATTGTRINLAKSFRAITRVILTLQHTGGNTAIACRADDKGTGSPPITGANGPLIKCFDAAGAVVAGNVDVDVVGY